MWPRAKVRIQPLQKRQNTADYGQDSLYEYELQQNGVKHGSSKRRAVFKIIRARRGIICLPGFPHQNMLWRMAESVQASVATPAGLSPTKVIIIKIVGLTAISLALIFGQAWAAPRTYKPEHIAGFRMGLLHGALMPAALPGLLGGHDVPIYAPNNDGRAYKIGYILGLNACGTFFFGVAFWKPRRRKNL